MFLLKQLYNKKLKTEVFRKQVEKINYLKNFKKNFSCFNRDQRCCKATCLDCVQYEYYYIQLFSKSSNLYSNVTFIFGIFKYHVNR